MYPQRELLKDPLVLWRKDLGENKFTYRVTLAKGLYFRVVPSTWKEILFIQMLIKGDTLEVPAEGNGLLIKAEAIPPIHPRR
jgi:hypothetical protein